MADRGEEFVLQEGYTLGFEARALFHLEEGFTIFFCLLALRGYRCSRPYTEEGSRADEERHLRGDQPAVRAIISEQPVVHFERRARIEMPAEDFLHRVKSSGCEFLPACADLFLQWLAGEFKPRTVKPGAIPFDIAHPDQDRSGDPPTGGTAPHSLEGDSGSRPACLGLLPRAGGCDGAIAQTMLMRVELSAKTVISTMCWFVSAFGAMKKTIPARIERPVASGPGPRAAKPRGANHRQGKEAKRRAIPDQGRQK